VNGPSPLFVQKPLALERRQFGPELRRLRQGRRHIASSRSGNAKSCVRIDRRKLTSPDFAQSVRFMQTGQPLASYLGQRLSAGLT
jgi:hypothetical protein